MASLLTGFRILKKFLRNVWLSSQELGIVECEGGDVDGEDDGISKEVSDIGNAFRKVLACGVAS